MAESGKIPLVGLFTAAQTLYTPLRHWIVNVRASYFDETREQVAGLWKTLGYKKIGVIYPEDAFGTAVLEGVRAALRDYGAEPAATGSGQRQTAPVGGAIDTVRGASLDTVVSPGARLESTFPPIISSASRDSWMPWRWSKASNGRGRI